MAYLNDQVIHNILQSNIRNINVKYNTNKIIKFKWVVAWQQAMFLRHINLRTSKQLYWEIRGSCQYFTEMEWQNITLTALSTLKIKADFLQDRFDSWVVKRATLLFNSFCSNVAKQFARFFHLFYRILGHQNRPLALRGHVTNAFFKQWVGILPMPKIVRAHKNYLTPEIWEETHLREIVYGTLIFQQSSMVCIGRHVGGHALSLQHGGQNYF